MKYAERITALQQTAYEIGLDIGFQQAMDYICMALNDAETMTGKPLGGDRIDRICRQAIRYQQEYHTAFMPKNPEADVYQEHLDAAQRRIFKERAQTFYERYPAIRRVNYGGRK